MGKSKNGRWSMYADCCIVCGTTNHEAVTKEGLCKLCWGRKRSEEKKASKTYISKEEIGRRISFSKLRPLISEEKLRHLYIDRQLSTTEIGKMIGVNRNAIRTRLHLFGIPVRSNSEASKIWANKPEVKERLRETAKTNMKDPEFYQNYVTKLRAVTVGRKPSKESIEKQRQKMIGRKRSEKHRKNLSNSLKKWATENPDKMKIVHEAHMKMMADTPKSGTDIEQKMAELLCELNLVFAQQHLVRCKFLVDFFLPEYLVVIEADGDYWHSKPSQKKKDASKDKYLTSLGLKVLRVWGSEINSNPEGVKRKITEVIRQCKVKQSG